MGPELFQNLHEVVVNVRIMAKLLSDLLQIRESVVNLDLFSWL